MGARPWRQFPARRQLGRARRIPTRQFRAALSCKLGHGQGTGGSADRRLARTRGREPAHASLQSPGRTIDAAGRQGRWRLRRRREDRRTLRGESRTGGGRGRRHQWRRSHPCAGELASRLGHAAGGFALRIAPLCRRQNARCDGQGGRRADASRQHVELRRRRPPSEAAQALARLVPGAAALGALAQLAGRAARAAAARVGLRHAKARHRHLRAGECSIPGSS